MTKQKSTKRALLLSALSLLVCVSMLIGSTFAWFTDSVTSAGNRIQAGTLDIVLEYSTDDGATWKNAEGQMLDFKTADGRAQDAVLWEPGCTYELPLLRVRNNGSLALKYTLAISGIDGDAKLLEAIDFTTKVGDAEKTSMYSFSGELVEKDQVSDSILIAGHMREGAGNEYQGLTADGISVTVFATQYTYEKDSFDELYDKNSAVSTVAEAEALMAENKAVILAGCNEPDAVLNIPAGYTQAITIVSSDLKSVQAEKDASLVIIGDVVINAKNGASTEDVFDGSAISVNGTLHVSGQGSLTAIAADVNGAAGIGGINAAAINIEDVTIVNAAGSYAYGVGTDTKYYKDAPEGGAAIGSGYNGATITLDNVTVLKAVGGSKAAGIGARYHTGVSITVKDSDIAYVEGGVSAAGIGGSRVSNGASENGTTINIKNSVVTAMGGAYGAGIGSGYDTHCQESQPMCSINITDSTVKATGGRYAAGVGTGYHNAALSGEIKNSTVTAVSGEKFYKDTYTQAQDIGFGVVDPAREGKQTDSYIVYNGTKITIPKVVVPTYITASNLSSEDFAADNARYVFQGEFTEDITINVASGLSQTYDASNATFADGVTVKINAPGAAHSYSDLMKTKSGSVTFKGFKVDVLNVLAYANEKVTISENEVKSMSVIGGNTEFVIDGNTVNGAFGKYTDGEGQTNEYGISLRIADYELSLTNNVITDAYSHAIGINGRQGEAASDWGNCGANNKIAAFSGNKITVNTTYKTERAALKIWCDQAYAPYATSGQQPNANAVALMESITSDSTNVFTLGAGHTTFNIFDYKQ